MTRQIIHYRTRLGRQPYSEYIDSLQDRRGAAKIDLRVKRVWLGNLGDHRTVGQGVVELRIDYGPGYRVYIGLHGQELVVLLCAGDKSSQAKDIQNTHFYWDDFRGKL